MKMNELVKVTKSITENQGKEQAKSIYAFCRMVTPQFYKNKSVEEMAAEIMSIQLLTQHINPEVLAKMCELAVEEYAAARAENDKQFFDVNYILTFYKRAAYLARGISPIIYDGEINKFENIEV